MATVVRQVTRSALSSILWGAEDLGDSHSKTAAASLQPIRDRATLIHFKWNKGFDLARSVSGGSYRDGKVGGNLLNRQIK